MLIILTQRKIPNILSHYLCLKLEEVLDVFKTSILPGESNKKYIRKQISTIDIKQIISTIPFWS